MHDRARSGAVVHVEFDRAGGGFPAHHVFPQYFGIGLDLVDGEHPALDQEVVIGGQRIKTGDRIRVNGATGVVDIQQ